MCGGGGKGGGKEQHVKYSFACSQKRKIVFRDDFRMRRNYMVFNGIKVKLNVTKNTFLILIGDICQIIIGERLALEGANEPFNFL